MNLKGKFAQVGAEIGRLVEEKNAAYGNSFIETGKIMQILYPEGIAPSQMTDALLLTRILDKCCRIAHRKGAFGESPYTDICGYGTCGIVMDRYGTVMDHYGAAETAPKEDKYERVHESTDTHDPSDVPDPANDVPVPDPADIESFYTLQCLKCLKRWKQDHRTALICPECGSGRVIGKTALKL